MTSKGSPVLVTGLPRSGTSWVGKMLEASGQVVYVNEPMNPQHPPGHSPGVLNATVTRRFQYITTDDDQQWQEAFSKTVGLRYQLAAELRRNHGAYDLARTGKYITAFTVGRLLGKRAMLDDPFALLSTRWLVEQMGVHAVVLVRNPVSFVGSWRSLGWTIHFDELLEQPALVRDHLGPYADQMRALQQSTDWLARICLLWCAVHDVVDTSLRRLPNVHVVHYEDLVQAPMVGFRQLYDTFGLTWSQRAQSRVQAATTGSDRSARSHAWSLRGGVSRTAYRPMTSAQALTTYQQRLTGEEIARVRALTDHIARRFQDPGDPATTQPAGTVQESPLKSE